MKAADMISPHNAPQTNPESEIRNPESAYLHLFFDLDHTLWDFELNSRRSWERLFKEYSLGSRLGKGFEPFFAAYKVHNDKLWEEFRSNKIHRNELRWKRIWLALLDFDLYDVNLAHELSSAYLEILPAQTALMPGAKEILEYCKSRYMLHLITNGFEMTQRQKLQYAGIAAYFDQLITSEKSGSVKPQTDIFDYALKAAGSVDVRHCLMIGDALDIDILGARNAGWDQVYYNPCGLPHNHRPTYEIHHWDELRAIV